MTAGPPAAASAAPAATTATATAAGTVTTAASAAGTVTTASTAAGTVITAASAAAAVAAAAPDGEALLDALCRIARLAAESLDLREVFERVAEATRPVLPFDRMGVMRIEGADTARLYAIAGGDGPRQVVEIGAPVPRCDISARLWPLPAARAPGQAPAHFPTEMAAPRRLDARQDLDPDFAIDRQILERGVRSILIAPLHAGEGIVGQLWYASTVPRQYAAAHEAAVARVAALIALALEHDRLSRIERERRRRGEALEALLLPALASALDVQQVFKRLAAAAQQVIPHDILVLGMLTADRTRVRLYASPPLGLDEVPEVPLNESMIATIGWEYFLVRDITFFPDSHSIRWHLDPPAGGSGQRHIDQELGPARFRMLTDAGVRSGLRVPVRLHGEVLGGLNFLSRQPGRFRPDEADPARRIADHVALALAHERLAGEQRRAAFAAERARHLETRIVRLTAELESGSSRRIAGRSRAWREALAQATKVAGTETTVLLTGESGTGKEVVARYIHRASPRAGGPFVALNCAALPDPLLESELFGYEKGAFTGATAAKPGSLDQAAGGVLFLDEVGEMSLLVQAKLLRVLEQREFQRLGGTRPIRAELRLVAATNRDLPAAIGRGQFREDLYYRLHVFEIRLPPLRERPEDIPALVEVFLADLGAAMGRPAAGISREARDRLLAHSWPGNVRELRNAIERALILCEGGLITGEHLPIAVAAGASGAAGAVELPPGGLALDDLERDLVAKALERSRGNRTRAARLLGLTRAQLYTRLSRHGLG
ncbi:MAG TPA: sigma 54-interacting transcriptional regulator [Thermoanaerobaculia bacterium]|nr:sigma 54-interacting transcriptional regulator [Thermoanaerobaculia bacterium]